jgi:nucleotide-binding universal stress UspA family protein
MFSRILVPIDLSDKHRLAVQTAVELARTSSGSVALLHVIETIQDVPFEDLEDFYRSLRERAEVALNKWAGEASALGLEVRRDIVFGRRAAEIIRYAQEQECDLIVLTSHKLDPSQPGKGLATLSHQVALVATCPVLLMR